MKNNRLLYLLVIILTIWCIILSVLLNNNANTTKNINEYNVSGFSTDFTEVIEKDKASVVTIKTDVGISSGFVYDQKGDNVYIVTSFHGVSNANSISVIFANTYAVNGEIVGTDIYADLALLKVNCPYSVSPLNFADSSLVKQGEFVISIGTPTNLDYAGSVELGMVSSKDLTIDNTIGFEANLINYYVDVIQTSSNLKTGYSGSPLINMNGDVIGMNTMSINTSNAFAITSNEIKIIVDNMLNGKKIEKIQLGISGTYVKNMMNYEKANLNLSINTINGLYVSKVKENSICFKAGIKVGDIITNINETPINSIDDYYAAVYKDTNELSINILRNNETISFNISLEND